jgi:hypothetical protein
MIVGDWITGHLGAPSAAIAGSTPAQRVRCLIHTTRYCAYSSPAKESHLSAGGNCLEAHGALSSTISYRHIHRYHEIVQLPDFPSHIACKAKLDRRSAN